MDDMVLFDSIERFLVDTPACCSSGHGMISSGGFDEASPVAHIGPPPLAPTGATPRKVRRKRHIEIQLLRDQVAQLESLREVLSKRQALETEQPPSTADGIAHWKAAAIVALQQREQAVATNLELRKLVRSRFDLARRVAKQIEQQQRQIHREMVGLTKDKAPQATNNLPTLRASAFQCEPAIYRHLADRASRLYERTAGVFAHPQLGAADSPVARLRDVRHFDGSPFLDAIDARLVPFDLYATAQAVWNWLSTSHAVMAPHQLVHFDVLENHTILSSFLTTQATAGHCQGNVVVRRFDEPDRVVFVKAMLADHKGLQRGTDTTTGTGVMVRHSEWIVLYRPIVEPSPTPSNCTEIVVRDLSEQEHDPTLLNELHGLLELHLTSYLDRMHEYVDNTLLAGAMPAY